MFLLGKPVCSLQAGRELKEPAAVCAVFTDFHPLISGEQRPSGSHGPCGLPLPPPPLGDAGRGFSLWMLTRHRCLGTQPAAGVAAAGPPWRCPARGTLWPGAGAGRHSRGAERPRGSPTAGARDLALGSAFPSSLERLLKPACGRPHCCLLLPFCFSWLLFTCREQGILQTKANRIFRGAERKERYDLC